MNTLTGIEAERVNQILKHCIDRLNILSNIPKSWDDTLLHTIDQDAVHSSIQKLWKNEKDLMLLDNESNEAGEEFTVMKQLHRSIRNACRNIQADKSAASQTLMRTTNKVDGIKKFVKYLDEMRLICLSRLTTTVEDEAAHRTLLHELTERERHFEESREALQAKLDEVLDEKEKTTVVLDQTLRKLQAEIQDISQYNAIDLESIQKEMNDAISKATTDHDLRMRQLQDQIDGMERRYAEVMEHNKDEELRLRKEKTRVETALSAKITSYDTDMAAKTKIYESLKISYERELKEYLSLKEHFDNVDDDINRMKEEDSLLSAVAAREQFGMWVLDEAAATIQKIVRGRLARFTFAKLKAKLSKKKKGKKGKNKKK